MACAIADEAGTIVESTVSSNTDSEVKENSIRVYPNPANSLLNVAIESSQRGQGFLTLVNVDGRIIMEQSLQLSGNQQIIPLNISKLQAGMYYVKVQAGSASYVEKVVVR